MLQDGDQSENGALVSSMNNVHYTGWCGNRVGLLTVAVETLLGVGGTVGKRLL